MPLTDDSADLATTAGVRKYLANTHFASDTIIALSGGAINFTYRIHLNNPFEGKETFVLKYAAPYMAAFENSDTIPFPTERQKFEVEALRLVLKMHAHDDVITVPAVHLFDEEAHIVIIDDCGADTQTLKQLVIDEALPQIVSEEIGAAIGRFLGRIHAWNKEASFDMGIFTHSEVGTMITAFITYDRLTSTLSGEDSLTALADPVLDIPKDKLDIISKFAEMRGYDVDNTSESFTHGDFWLGNIIVSLRREKGRTPKLDKIYVLDWELAKAGLRGVDIGQFCAEMHLLRRFYPDRQEEASTIIGSFLSAYKAGNGFDEDLARVTAAHIGAHLVAWAPRNWSKLGEREEIERTVAEGVELLVGGTEGTLAWLETNLIGNLP